MVRAGLEGSKTRKTVPRKRRSFPHHHHHHHHHRHNHKDHHHYPTTTTATSAAATQARQYPLEVEAEHRREEELASTTHATVRRQKGRSHSLRDKGKHKRIALRRRHGSRSRLPP